MIKTKMLTSKQLVSIFKFYVSLLYIMIAIIFLSLF